MTIAELRELVRLMDEGGLVELEVEEAGRRVRLVRALGAGTGAEMRRSAVSLGDPGAGVVADGGGAPDASLGRPGAEPALIAISSPMVGTFYRSPAPGAPPFVEPGDPVVAGQAVCIIEAMKMMNEVRAEGSGRVVRILAENGAAVEYGAPLFELDPRG